MELEPFDRCSTQSGLIRGPDRRLTREGVDHRQYPQFFVSVRRMHFCVYEARFRTCGLAHVP